MPRLLGKTQKAVAVLLILALLAPGPGAMQAWAQTRGRVTRPGSGGNNQVPGTGSSTQLPGNQAPNAGLPATDAGALPVLPPLPQDAAPIGASDGSFASTHLPGRGPVSSLPSRAGFNAGRPMPSIVPAAPVAPSQGPAATDPNAPARASQALSAPVEWRTPTKETLARADSARGWSDASFRALLGGRGPQAVDAAGSPVLPSAIAASKDAQSVSVSIAPAAARLAPAGLAAAPAPAPVPASAPTLWERAKGFFGKKPAIPAEAVREDALGFRSVKGLEREGVLALSSDASAHEVRARIAAQFGLSEPALAALGRRLKVEDGDRRAWLSVYDKMQALNESEFQRLDHLKYKVSFRDLVGTSYAPGLRGTLRRGLEVQKTLAGVLWRFPVGLLDAFFFNYFRQPLAYRLSHAREDFLSLRGQDGLAERWVAAYLQEASFAQGGTAQALNAHRGFRVLRAVLWVPVAAPLLRFVTRRGTLALAGAAATGLLATAAPFLPLSLHLAALPVFGPALTWAVGGIPAAVSSVPFVGAAFAPVLQSGLEAFYGDLVLGKLAQTAVLSTLLTLPRAFRLEWQRAWTGSPEYLDPLPRFWKVLRLSGLAAVRSVLPGSGFWSSNLKTLFGMTLVGAEIESVVSYADVADAALFGRLGWQPFHAIAASVEKPAGQSPIPFGGAITWGQTLLHHAEEASGLSVSDAVYLGANRAVQAVAPNDVTGAVLDLPVQRGLASQMLAAASGPLTPEDKAKAETLAERAAKAGKLQEEIAKAQAEASRLRAEIVSTSERLRALRAGAPGLPPERERRLREELAVLDRQRAELDTLSKLAQSSDLEHPVLDAAKAQEIDKLLSEYKAVLSDGTADPGLGASLANRQASLDALSSRLKELLTPGGPRGRGPVRGERERLPPSAEPDGNKRLSELVEEIDALRKDAATQFMERQQAARSMQGLSRARSAALSARRGGPEKLEFNKNFARLSMVMDLSYSLNILNSVEDAIMGMKKKLDEKEAAIDASERDNTAGKAAAEENLSKIPEWLAKAQQDLADSRKQGTDLSKLTAQAEEALVRLPAFKASLSGLLNAIDAEDGRSGRTASQEYDYRVNVRIPELIDFRTNGYPGADPNDTGKLSVKSLQDQLRDVDQKLADVEAGLPRLQNDNEISPEVAGILIIEVPGIPKNTNTNPSREDLLSLLEERKRLFTLDLNDYQAKLDSLAKSMDPGNATTAVDDFGDPIYESHVYWLAQEKTKSGAEESATRQRLSRIDAAAQRIKAAVPGADLPSLSGLTRQELVDQLTSYLDRLDRLPAAADDDLAFQVTMAKLEIGTELPWAGRHLLLWSKAAETVKALEEATQQILPITRTRLTQVRDLMRSILADVELDLDLVRTQDFKNLSEAQQQALIERKRSLIIGQTMPVLQGARALIANVLIPFQEGSVETLREVPGKDGLVTLFKKSKEIYEKTESGLNKTFPWQLASNGGLEGDVPGSKAKIDEREGFFRDNLKTILDNKEEIRKREDPNYVGTEVTLGREMDYSLPKRIAAFSAERAERARSWNKSARELNEYLAKIDAGTNGKHNLVARFTMPTDIAEAGGTASTDRVRTTLEGSNLTDLGDILDQIGKSADLGGGVDLGSTSGIPPAGRQPDITLSPGQKLALESLAAAKRLVPNANGIGVLSLSGAEYLFADGIETASTRFLNERVPKAKAFLTLGEDVLSASIADLDRDRGYVTSNGTSETPEALYNRKLAVIGRQKEFAAAGKAFFQMEKEVWDQEFIDGLADIETLYEGLRDLRKAGNDVNATDRDAVRQIRKVLDEKLAEFRKEKSKVQSWLRQLNDPHESALRRVSESVARIQALTREVLEKNKDWHVGQKDLGAKDADLRTTVGKLNKKQMELDAELRRTDIGRLRADKKLFDDVRRLSQTRGAWMLPKDGSQETLVIPKSQLPVFLDNLLSGLFAGASASTQNIDTLKNQVLADPTKISSVLPDSHLMEFGDDHDGFYLLYRSDFGTPKGFETSQEVVLGNLTRLAGSNVSVRGYRFISPPNEVNAPFGDQGVTVSAESLEGERWVNYLDITAHKFSQDIPTNATSGAVNEQMRLMVFEDYAMLLAGDRLYIGFTGYGDISNPLQGPEWKEKPHYYGGNLKTELKLTEVVRLNAEQQMLFAKDPRQFWQKIDLSEADLGVWDVIGRGQDKEYRSTKLGGTVDVGRATGLTDPALDENGVNTNRFKQFDVDLYWKRVGGTDDFNQDSVGASVLTGVTIAKGVHMRNRATFEKGSHHDTLADRVDLELPAGFAVFAEGKLAGTGSASQVGVAKKMGAATHMQASYGSPYIGVNNRLTIMTTTSFTLADLWKKVVDDNSERLAGGKTLAVAQKELEALLGSSDKRQHQELKRVFHEDVGRQLLTQGVGTLTKDLEELYRAGAVLENTRVKGMVGWVSNPVGDHTADRAVGGGWQMGTMTELAISKTQKALVEKKIGSILRESLKLQQRLGELTKQWQGAVMEAVGARWELRLAEFLERGSPDEAMRSEARVRVERARARLRQAELAYNHLTGRPPDAELPFNEISPEDALRMMADLGEVIAAPDRLSSVLAAYGPDRIEKRMPQARFNLVDWIPFIEKLSVSFGFQLQDALANQAMGLGGSIRIPVYDPESDAKDKSYKLESKAAMAEMVEVYESYRLSAQKERIDAVAWKRQAEILAASQAQAAEQAAKSIASYRNGLSGAASLRQSFDGWLWYTKGLLESRSREALARNQALLDGSLMADAPRRPALPASLRDGFEVIRGLDPKKVESRLAEREAARKADKDRITHAAAKPTADPAKAEEERARLNAIAERKAGDHAGADYVAKALNISPKLAEAALRAEAAQEAMAAADHRIAKVSLDLHAGLNLTASGIGWLPQIGFTGFGIYPVLGMKVKPQVLRELEVLQEGERKVFYEALQDKIRTDLAVELHQAYVVLKTSYESETLYKKSRLPQLEDRLAKAQERLSRGEPVAEEVRSLRYELDQAKSAALSAQTKREQAQALFNYLLGRPMASAVDLSDSLEDAQALLAAHLQEGDALASRRTLLRSRVKIARAYQQEVDQNLASQEIAFEPLSLALSSLGRLIHTLADEPYASPDKVVWARHQVLASEKAQENFERSLPSMRVQLKAEAAAAEAEARRHEGRADPAGRIAAQEALQKLHLVRAQLATLGEGAPDAPAAKPLPTGYEGLRRAVVRAFEQAASPLPEDSRGEKAPTELPAARSFHRLYRLNQSLGSDPIGKSFVESWAEVRLGSPDTASDVLLELSRFARERADSRYRQALRGAEIQAEAKLAKFVSDVSFWRAAPAGSALKARLDANLRRDAAEMAAMLDASPATTLEQLAALVPAGGPERLEDASRHYMEKVHALNIEALQLTLDPETKGHGVREAERKIDQAQADVIASRMSYKGFTPIAAFGYFRDRFVAGAFLEAPDPNAIEKNLSNVLGDAIRKELESRGELKRLALRLHSLMFGVQDGARLAEVQQARLDQARAALEAAVARHAAGQITASELSDARDHLDNALVELAGTLTKLRGDFEELVGELRALELPPAEGPVFRPGADTEASALLASGDPVEELLRYGVSRMNDEAFAARLDERLSASGVGADLREKLSAAGEEHRRASGLAAQVRGISYPAAEKIDLLTTTDVEGRRLNVEGAARPALEPVLRKELEGKAGTDLVRFLYEDLQARAKAAGKARGENQSSLASIREGYWRSLGRKEKVVEGAFSRLEDLHGKAQAAWQDLLTGYLAETRGADRFVLTDLRLDAYLKAQAALDRELLVLFASKELKSRPALARALDGFFDLKASGERQKRVLRFGRGAAALDAMLGLGEARLAALRYDGAAPAEVRQAADTVAALHQTRERWMSKPRDIEPLYAATAVDAQGRRTWRIAEWLTASDVKVQEGRGRVKTVEGRLFLLAEGQKAPRSVREAVAGGARELIGGQDAAAGRLRLSREGLDAEELAAQTRAELARSDFALGRAGEVKGLDHAAFEKAVSEGRIFFFESKPDARSGGKKAMHPLLALTQAPGSWEAYYYEGSQPLKHADYPTAEMLDPGAFWKVEVGAKGLEAMAAAARSREASALRAGWASLKLHAYGFALKDGRLRAVYLSKDEMESARKRSKMDPDQLKEYLKDRDAEEDPITENPDPEASWNFVRSEDMRWGLTQDGTLSRVEAPGLEAQTLSAGAVERWVSGPVLAMEADEQGRIRRVYQKASELEAASKGWTLIDANWALSDPKGARVAPGAKEVRPTLRAGGFENAEGRPVVLGLGALSERLDALESEFGSIRRWAIMPNNWANILLETPRGILKVPLEVFLARDPKHEGYLGRVTMYRTEGGATESRNVFSSFLHFIDVFELLPDPVRRFHDPSQYPSVVKVDERPSALSFTHDQDARTEEEDIHFGREFLRREKGRAREAVQGRFDSSTGRLRGGLRDRVFTDFIGGLERTVVEQRRGRGERWDGGFFHRGGPEQWTDAQKQEMEAWHRAAFNDGRAEFVRGRGAWYTEVEKGTLDESPSGEALLSERPDNLEVRMVEARVKARLGAEDFRRSAVGLEEALKESRRSQAPARDRQALRRDAEAEAKKEQAAKDRRAELAAKERALFERTRRDAWLSERDRSRDREIVYLQRKLAQLKKALAFQEYYLEKLYERLGDGPRRPGDSRRPVWQTVLIAAAVIAVVGLIGWALWRLLKPKKK